MEFIPMRTENFKATNVFLEETELDGSPVLRVTKDPIIVADDEATYAKFVGSDFGNGCIEVKVRSRLLTDAPDHARGFIGLAFRIDETDDQFESIYIRPTNGESENQIRRNRTVQYFSYPEYKYDRFRKENPGQYETYAEIALDEWIDMKIEVNNNCAKLYLNHPVRPSFIVNDLKLGANTRGAIGLWVDVGTEGFFKDLKVTIED